MSSSRSIPLNVNVEPQLKSQFTALCESENINVATAIQDYMRWSINRGSVNASDSSPTHFRDREIETLKDLAVNYNQLLENFNLLQKLLLGLEEIIHRILAL